MSPKSFVSKIREIFVVFRIFNTSCSETCQEQKWVMFGDIAPLRMSHKVLIIRPNTTYRYSTIVFYYTLQHVLAVQFSHQQVDIGYTERNIKGDRRLFALL